MEPAGLFQRRRRSTGKEIARGRSGFGEARSVIRRIYRLPPAMSDNVRMRIAFLTHQWPGARMGGIGAAVRQTALALAQAGHDVHVFTFTLPQDVREKL